jgi:hypothetical protein
VVTAGERSEVWRRARAALDGLPGARGLNIAHEAVDRHLGTDPEGRCAIRWLGRHDERERSFGAQIDEAMRVLDGVDRVVWLTVAEKWPCPVEITQHIRAAPGR